MEATADLLKEGEKAKIAGLTEGAIFAKTRGNGLCSRYRNHSFVRIILRINHRISH